MLQGVTMLQSEAMPTTGFLKSSSVKPTGRSIERAPARLGPSLITEENLRVESEGEFMAKNRRRKPEPGGRGKRVRLEQVEAGNQASSLTVIRFLASWLPA